MAPPSSYSPTVVRHTPDVANGSPSACVFGCPGPSHLLPEPCNCDTWQPPFPASYQGPSYDYTSYPIFGNDVAGTNGYLQVVDTVEESDTGSATFVSGDAAVGFWFTTPGVATPACPEMQIDIAASMTHGYTFIAASGSLTVPEHLWGYAAITVFDETIAVSPYKAMDDQSYFWKFTNTGTSVSGSVPQGTPLTPPLTGSFLGGPGHTYLVWIALESYDDDAEGNAIYARVNAVSWRSTCTQ